MWKNKAYLAHRKALADIATKTKETTPVISTQLPHLDTSSSECLSLASMSPLEHSKCPRFNLSYNSGAGTLVRVFNLDALDAAIAMPSQALNLVSSRAEVTTVELEDVVLNQLKSSAAQPDNLHAVTAARVAVLNMASEFNPGGGWLKGSTAQEEAICYRSTLAGSLHREWYPIPARSGLYTRDVVVFRTSMGDGHSLMIPEVSTVQLPVVSALSVAGIRRPLVTTFGQNGQDSDEKVLEKPGDEATCVSENVRGVEGEPNEDPGTWKNKHFKNKDKNKKKGGRRQKREFMFAEATDRDLTKDKMRLCLRMAASKGHTMLVLGAIGCGAFRNPPQEIANCWMEVLDEDEFAGGWFKELWFAVFDKRNEGNFEMFEEMFDGKLVGVRKLSDGSNVDKTV